MSNGNENRCKNCILFPIFTLHTSSYFIIFYSKCHSVKFFLWKILFSHDDFSSPLSRPSGRIFWTLDIEDSDPDGWKKLEKDNVSNKKLLLEKKKRKLSSCPLLIQSIPHFQFESHVLTGSNVRYRSNSSSLSMYVFYESNNS